MKNIFEKIKTQFFIFFSFKGIHYYLEFHFIQFSNVILIV